MSKPPELKTETQGDQGVISVRTLGAFSLSAVESADPQEFPDAEAINISGRGRRVWSLIAYLVIHRDRDVPVTELIDVLWDENDSREDPLKTLQHNVSRARDMLQRCGLPNARDLIVAHQGSYRWNPKHITSVDLECFQQLAAKAAAADTAEESIVLYKEAIGLYKGDFLPGLEMESWVTPISAFGRSLYVNQCLELTRLLSGAQNMGEIAAICEKALRLAPESEELNTRYVRALTADGCPEKAVTVYENVRRLLSERLGVMPSPELELAYEEARQSIKGDIISISTIKDILQEESFDGEGMRCDWNSFLALVRREARNSSRASREAVVVSLCFRAENYALEARRIESALAKCLRTGDVYTRLNSKQFLALLPEAGGQNARAIVDRVIRFFRQRFPQSTAEISSEWYVLENPAISEAF